MYDELVMQVLVVTGVVVVVVEDDMVVVVGSGTGTKAPVSDWT